MPIAKPGFSARVQVGIWLLALGLFGSWGDGVLPSLLGVALLERLLGEIVALLLLFLC